jgi:hypothetical protein
MAVVEDAQKVRRLDGDSALIDPFITGGIGHPAELKAQMLRQEFESGRPLGRPVVMPFAGEVDILGLVGSTA